VTEANTKLEGLLTQRADGSLHLLGNPHDRCSCLGMRFELTMVFFRPSRACYFPFVGPCHLQSSFMFLNDARAITKYWLGCQLIFTFVATNNK